MAPGARQNQHHPQLPNSLGLGLCYTQCCVYSRYLSGCVVGGVRGCITGWGGLFGWCIGSSNTPLSVESWLSTTWLACSWYTLITRLRRILDFKCAYVPLSCGWLGPWVLLFSPLVGVVAPSPFFSGFSGRPPFSSGQSTSSSSSSSSSRPGG